MNAAQLFGQRLNLNFGKISLSPSYIQVGVILVLLFLLILVLAQLRRHFVDWSFKGAIVGLFLGFVLALILEGFLVVGGKTAITQVLGWSDPPKPVANILEIGRNKLIQVLGQQIETRAPEVVARINPTFSDALKLYQSLNPGEAQKLKEMICAP